VPLLTPLAPSKTAQQQRCNTTTPHTTACTKKKKERKCLPHPPPHARVRATTCAKTMCHYMYPTCMHTADCCRILRRFRT
jgi:hypothetical protein